MEQELTIGLDIGGTKMAIVVADRAGNLHHKSELPTEAAGDIADALDRIARQLNLLVTQQPTIAGIGIGVPGPVNPQRGIALFAANLGWENLELRAGLAERLARPLPIFLDNDVNAGAVGEQLFGAAKGVSDFVYLTLGTGLGGAAVSDNRLLRGASNSEMEIGHISLDPVNGRPCACGLRGCLEMSASGNGIVAHAREHIGDWPETSLNAECLTPRDIIKRAADGDTLAAHVINEAAQALGIAAALCVNLFNPSLIILAGGLARASWHLLEGPMLAAMRARCLPINRDAVTIALSTLTDGALGASALVWRGER